MEEHQRLAANHTSTQNENKLQRRHSGSIGNTTEALQISPVPATNMHQAQQSNMHLYMPNQFVQQQQYPQFNQQYEYGMVPVEQNIQQPHEMVQHIPEITLPQQPKSETSEPNSLHPSPVSPPALVNHQMGQHQHQHILQPILNYQQMPAQGDYTQQPIATVQSQSMQATALSNTEASPVAPPPGSPTEVVKRGRFRVSKVTNSSNNLNETFASQNGGSRKESSDNAASNEIGSTGVEAGRTAQVDAATKKKKGRFVVKTGATNQPAKSTTIACEDNITQSPNATNDDKIGDIPVDAAITQPAGGVNENPASKTADPNNVSTKKKGRFVVKKGGNNARCATPPLPHQNETSSLDGSISKQSIPTVVSTITDNFQDPPLMTAIPNPNALTASPYQPQNQQICVPHMTNLLTISNVQPVGAYDVNGNFVYVSTPVMMPHQPQPVQPQPQPNSNIVQSTHAPSQPQHSSSMQQPPYMPDVPPHKQKKPAHIPKAPRPDNTNRQSLGGRLFGTTGVGKVLHHLESVRLEVIEADKSLASLQSENRILKDKNKELEAKNAKLERQLAEERAKNRKLTKSLDASSAIAHPAGSVIKRSNSIDKSVDQMKKSDSSVDSSSPSKQLNRVQNEGERTPTKQSKEFVDDSSETTIQLQNGGLSTTPRLGMTAPEASSHSTASETGSNFYESSSVETTPQQFTAFVTGLDPLPTVPSTVTSVTVPVLAPKEVKRFDPLGTPKRSGSKLLTDPGNFDLQTELSGAKQDAALPSTAMIFQPIPAATTTAVMPLPTLAQPTPMIQPQPAQQTLSTCQQQPQQQQELDPFDEIALRHGGSQNNGNG